MNKEKVFQAINAFGGNLSADTINNLSADTIKNLSADTINNLSAYTIKNLEKLWNDVPVLVNPYTQLWNDLQEKKRKHNQSDWGPDCDPGENLCGTQMCTAGHLVNMAGQAGYELKKKFNWDKAASLIHLKAHPNAPYQNFGGIKQEYAIAYIEMMSDYEQRADQSQSFDQFLESQLN